MTHCIPRRIAAVLAALSLVFAAPVAAEPEVTLKLHHFISPKVVRAHQACWPLGPSGLKRRPTDG